MFLSVSLRAGAVRVKQGQGRVAGPKRQREVPWSVSEPFGRSLLIDLSEGRGQTLDHSPASANRNNAQETT